MVALCNKRETVKRDRAQQRAKVYLPIKTKPLEAGTEPLPSPRQFPLLMQAGQCPDCIGNERLSLKERAFTYYHPTVINDHFDDYHLVGRERAEQYDEKIQYYHPEYRDVKFQNLNYFRAYVQRVHSITLRSLEQVERRRLRKARRRHIVRGNCQQEDRTQE